MRPVRLYTTNTCGYCFRAKDLLERRGVPYEEIDVTDDDDMRERLVELSGGRRTVPQIFFGERHIGGYTDLAELAIAGKLDDVLQ